MCTRITLISAPKQLEELFDSEFPSILMPRFNVAPAQMIPVVRNDGRGGREVSLMKWGLVPQWSSDPKHGGFVNARAETISEKPSFREAFRHRRCLVAADGFYEWQQCGKKKQPFHFRTIEGRPFAIAAIWEPGVGDENSIDTVALVTIAANEIVQPLHDRMPAILPPERFAPWLDSQEERPEKLMPLLAPYPADRMTSWPVSSRVNSVKVEEPGLTTAVTLAAPRHQPGLFDEL